MQHHPLPRPVSLLCAAAQEDQRLLAQWETHLLPLQQAGLITFWSERHLRPGDSRITLQAAHLAQADFLILLVSADFFADHTCLALMNEGLARQQEGRLQVIPLLLRPVAWQASALGSLACLPTDGAFVSDHPDHDQAFHACLQELCVHLNLSTRLLRSAARGKALAETNRERMLRRLDRSYRELLAQSFQTMPWLDLEFITKPGAVQNVTNQALRMAPQAELALSASTTIIQIYEEAEQELLILGEPGSGKSTQLLSLAQHLVRSAAQDDTGLLPVILPLSSWASHRNALADWLREQIALLYDIPRSLSGQWVEQGQILPLVDGLDEMEEAARPLCIAAINAYHRASLTPLVVCSRRAEYEAAASLHHLALQNAVLIRPLSPEQIDPALDRAGEAGAGLRTVLRGHPALRELATTPLMLTVLVLAYQEAAGQAQAWHEANLPQQVWADYVRCMIERKGDARRYSLQQMHHWLGWLARQMRTQNQTVFSVEQIQPDWLPEPQHSTYHRLGVRLPAILIGVLAGVLIGWFFLGFSGFFLDIVGWSHLVQEATVGGLLGELLVSRGSTAPARARWRIRLVTSPGLGGIMGVCLAHGPSSDLPLHHWVAGGALIATTFSLSFFLLSMLLIDAHPRPSSDAPQGAVLQSVRQLTRAVVVALLLGSGYGVSIWLSVWLSDGLRTGVHAGLSYGVIIGLGFGLVTLFLGVMFDRFPEGIQLTERVRWTWPQLRARLVAAPHLRAAILLTIGIALCVGLTLWLSGKLEDWLRYGLGVSLCVGLLDWLLLGSYQSLVQEPLEDHHRRVPNQGIRQSLRNSLVLGLISGAVIASMGILTFGMSAGQAGVRAGVQNVWLPFLVGSLLVWVLTGGLAVWRHYLVRGLLASQRLLPFQIPRFLDSAVTCILLQRHRGGYCFVHRLLLNFLADHQEASAPLIPGEGGNLSLPS